MATTTVSGACPHDCPDTCGLLTEVVDGRAIRVTGDPDHPITQGWLCAKVRPYLDHVYHPDRLTQPLRRTGRKGEGRWAAITWDEAIGEIAERWRTIIGEHGAAAILPYSYSGTLGLVQMVVSSARFWNRLGASRLERTICGSAAEYAVGVTLGGRRAPAYGHLEDSRLIVVWGHNPVSTAPHAMPSIRTAQRRGATLVVIDPRRTRTARTADWHLAPLPGTDGALALGLANVIVREGLHDEPWLEAHTVGWPLLRDRVADYPPARVAAICGLPEASIVELARMYARTRPAAIKFSDGIQRRVNGGQTVRALAMLPALTGQYGVRGGGLFYSTSGYYRWNQEAVHHWAGSPPPARMVNMCRLGAALTGEAVDPRVHALYVFGANPAAVSPNAGLIVKGLMRDDLFTVVHELYMTDTADYADIVLPATSQLEHVDLHRGYGHTFLSYNAQAIAPVGDALSNWDVLRRLATALGFDEPWLHQTPDEVIDEVLTATAADNPAFDGITLDRLKRERYVPLAVTDEVPYADGHFPTPSGKVELHSAALAAVGQNPLPEWTPDEDSAPRLTPLASVGDGRAIRLVTPAAHHFVTSSFANDPHLARLEGTPFIELNPADAAARHIADGDAVVVENSRGTCVLRAVVTDALGVGVAASPKGYWSRRGDARVALEGEPEPRHATNVNWTTNDALADFAGQSTFHTNDVWIRRVDR